MTAFVLHAAAIVLIFATVPHLFFGRGARTMYVALHGGVLTVALALSFAAARLGFAWSSETTLALLITGSLFAAAATCWASAPGDIRIDAKRAVLLAACVYALALPFMLRSVLDGDEPYYLLETESLVHDGDLDLRNQYADLQHSVTGRVDLRPQPDDPIGARGQQYSRHEPLLALLLIPGFLVAGKIGAVTTIALFGVLLCASLTALLIESGYDARAVLLTLIAVAFTQPVLFYALRIWPEVPAALCFTEALRSLAANRRGRFVAALCAISLLKLRFIAIAVPLLLLFVRREGKRARTMIIVAAVVIAVPLFVAWRISGNALNVHTAGELQPGSAFAYVRGFFGLLLDGQHGLLFAAPLLFFALLALLRRRPEGLLRVAVVAALPYVVLLLPRAEWHGGWSPPVRYLVVFAPLFALAFAAALERFFHPALLLLGGAASAGLTLHGLVQPWRLFHIENGEAFFGEFLSARYGADFSRVVPSFVRWNDAATVAIASFIVCAVIAWRVKAPFGRSAAAIASLAVAALFGLGMQPHRIIEFEDAHVEHSGGELYPEMWAVSRFAYSGGWRVTPGATVRFRSLAGKARLEYSSGEPTTLIIDGVKTELPTGQGIRSIDVSLRPRDGRSTIVCVWGNAVLDRVTHE